MNSNGNDKTEKKPMKQRALIGIADSAIVFLIGKKKVTARAANGELAIVYEPVSIPLKLASAPIGGYTAGGGCAFNITEKWCKKQGFTFREVEEFLQASEAYGLRYVFEDDERIDPTTEQPYYKRVLTQIAHRHNTEKKVQAEAYEVNALASENVIA